MSAGDFLLVYRLAAESKQEQIVFVRAGIHADLFEE